MARVKLFSSIRAKPAISMRSLMRLSKTASGSRMPASSSSAAVNLTTSPSRQRVLPAFAEHRLVVVPAREGRRATKLVQGPGRPGEESREEGTAGHDRELIAEHLLLDRHEVRQRQVEEPAVACPDRARIRLKQRTIDPHRSLPRGSVWLFCSRCFRFWKRAQ